MSDSFAGKTCPLQNGRQAAPMRPFPFVQRKPATSDGRNGGPNCQLSSGRGEGPSIESVPLWSVVVKHLKKEQFWPFFGCCTLIHRLTQADISCTTTARLFFFVRWSFRRRTKRGPRMVTSHTFFLYKNNFGRQQVQLLARCGFWKMLLGVCIEVTPLSSCPLPFIRRIFFSHAAFQGSITSIMPRHLVLSPDGVQNAIKTSAIHWRRLPFEIEWREKCVLAVQWMSVHEMLLIQGISPYKLANPTLTYMRPIMSN